MEIQDERRARQETPETSEAVSSVPSEGVRRPFLSHLITFLILLFLWVVLSGKFDLFHLSLGVISCAIVTFFSGDLFLPELRTGGLLRAWFRFVRYIPWLLYQILLANLHVLYLVLHPRMLDLIDPRIIRFQSKLKKELSLVTFGNSITLTPGTITVYVSVDGDFQVHVIDKKSGESFPGEMETRIARAFGEK